MVGISKRTGHIPDPKNGESRTVPLPSETGRILSDRPRRLDGEVWGDEKERKVIKEWRLSS